MTKGKEREPRNEVECKAKEGYLESVEETIFFTTEFLEGVTQTYVD